MFFQDIIDTVLSTFKDAVEALNKHTDEPEVTSRCILRAIGKRWVKQMRKN